MAKTNSLSIRGDIEVECTNCAHDNLYTMEFILNKFGWDISKWAENIKDPKNRLVCSACKKEIEINEVKFEEFW